MIVIDGIRVEMAKMVEEEQMGDKYDDRARAWWEALWAANGTSTPEVVAAKLAAAFREVAAEAEARGAERERAAVSAVLTAARQVDEAGRRNWNDDLPEEFRQLRVALKAYGLRCKTCGIDMRCIGGSVVCDHLKPAGGT